MGFTKPHCGSKPNIITQIHRAHQITVIVRIRCFMSKLQTTTIQYIHTLINRQIKVLTKYNIMSIIVYIYL